MGTVALRIESQSAWMSKIKNGELDQYGGEPFEQQQFGTAGAERVKYTEKSLFHHSLFSPVITHALSL